MTSATQTLLRAGLKVRVQEALNAMDATDREVLALRHFEQLTNAEVSRELGIEVKTASKRYTRALRRLRDILDNQPGGLGESWL